ncbi:MAG: GDSL-type esterase/lipase family protein [Dysgonamonadaceae bacterium]|jgi:lysophospholipase L1-like esterase|nr:GDSL-type esterase/lipase family protein [Dysgonamonadaceae bacterium]
MKKTIIYSCISLLAAFSATTNGTDKIRVACMGNSITAGNYNYPTPLGAMLGDDYDVRSFGKGGSGVFIEDRIAFDGNDDGVYVRTQECADALAFNPDIVTIKLGTNDVGEFFFCEKNFWYTDCSQKTLRDGVRERFKNDYMTLINMIKALPANPRIILCYPVRLYPKGMFGQGAAMDEVIRTEQHTIVDNIAEEQGFEVIDLWEPTRDMEENFPDGCHPNHQGSYEIAKAVYRGITGKSFDEQAIASFIPELKTPYCIVNKYNGKVMEVKPSSTTYGVVTSDFESDNEAQQFLFENLTYDVFRIRTSFKNAEDTPYYLAIKPGPVGLLEIGYNWGASDNILSIQVSPAEDEYYTMGVWKSDSYMGITKSSTTVRGGKKLADLSDYDKWSFVKTSEMQPSAIKQENNAPYQVTIENGNTISVKNAAPLDKIVLYNVSGQTVYSTVAESSQVFIPVSKGFYVLSAGNKAVKIIAQ